jgi:DeoR/GlpR family transcriptional regulator of sugar metabolism
VTRSSLRQRNATERQEWIILVLRARGFLSVADISGELDVSHMTVRRDLKTLEKAGQVRTVHGGVSLSSATLHDSSQWAKDNGAAEARIGECAATLVDENDTIAIDAGRLGYEVARALSEQFRGTVVTHSIPVIQLLASRSRPPRVVGLGGEVVPDRCAFFGASTVAAIAGVRVRTLFIAPDAVDSRGAYAYSDPEASVKRALLNVADRTVLVANHERFADRAPLQLGVLRQFATLVTDRPPSDKVETALRQAGVSTLVARGGRELVASHNGYRHPPGRLERAHRP